MSEAATIELLCVDVGAAALALGLDDVVRIAERDIGGADAGGDAPEPVPTVDLDEAFGGPGASTRVFHCEPGDLLAPDSGEIRTFDAADVHEIPILVRAAAEASGVTRLIWEPSRDAWRFWVSPSLLLNPPCDADDATQEERA